MIDRIKHLGVVESIQGNMVRVRIQQTSACSGCSAKGHCQAAESKEKLFDVYNEEGIEYQIGQQVLCCITTSLGLKAVAIAFVIPFILMLIVLFTTMHMTDKNEGLSALAALGVLIPYYILIYLMRKRLIRTFSFTLETLHN